MPKVGDKTFEYSPQGIREAQEYAAKTGRPVEKSQRYHVGGIVCPSDKAKGKKNVRGMGIARRGGSFNPTENSHS